MTTTTEDNSFFRLTLIAIYNWYDNNQMFGSELLLL